VPRREQRAAVLVGDDRDGIGAQALGCGRNLVLVHADERAEHRQRHRCPGDRHVLEGLRRHLPDRVAGHQSVRAHSRGNSGGDPKHEAAIDDHAQGTRDGQSHLPLDLADGHELQPAAQLEPRQEGGQFSRLVLRGARQEGVAVEVHEGGRAAAPHHPPCCHRRVDAARQEGHHAPARAGRQAARAGLLAEMIEGLAGHDLDADGESGVP